MGRSGRGLGNCSYVCEVHRPVSTAVPKIKVTRPRQDNPVVTKPNSPPRRLINRSPSPKASNYPPKVTAVKAPIVNAAKMCDKKNSVLFTDTKCLVLSPEFKLPDENQVLLRVHRENNMYNVDLKNIIPSRDLTFKGNLVRGLPSKVFKNDNTCVACKKGKQHRASCKTKPVSSINQPLYMLHMKLFGPTFVKRLNKKSYCLVVTDDYSRFTWVFFLAIKDETSPILKTFITGLENQLSLKVKVIKSDNGTELKNNDLNQLCGMKGIKRKFSVPRTPQQNDITERKNRTLIENRVLVTKPHNMTPYELFTWSNTKYWFYETFWLSCSGPTWLFDIDSLTKTMNYQPVTTGNQSNHSAGVQEHFDAEKAGEESDQQYNTDRDVVFDEKEPEFDEKKSESEVNVSPSSSSLKISLITAFMSAAGPLNAAASPTHGKSSCIDTSQLPDDPDMPELEDITYSDDEDDVGAKADFNNLEISITVSPIPTTRVHKDHPITQIIGDLSSATQIRSMKRVAKDQGHTHEEGIDYKEVFAPVARIEAIRLFLAYVFFMGFMVYQMDVKSAFLYGTIKEEVYVCQPLGFEDLDYPDKVYKVVKALFGLHQAPRAWYKTLANYLLENGFQRGKIDQTLFIKRKKGDILLVQIYVDDIIFDGKSASTPIDTEKPLLKDPDGEDVDVHIYKSMIGSLMYLTSSRPDIMFAVYACARF
nr:hypothetical protein [Tanacetum cinerariifolium]